MVLGGRKAMGMYGRFSEETPGMARFAVSSCRISPNRVGVLASARVSARLLASRCHRTASIRPINHAWAVVQRLRLHPDEPEAGTRRSVDQLLRAQKRSNPRRSTTSPPATRYGLMFRTSVTVVWNCFRTNGG